MQAAQTSCTARAQHSYTQQPSLVLATLGGGFKQQRKGIIEWLGSEVTSRIINLQPPCHMQGQTPYLMVSDQADEAFCYLKQANRMTTL